MYVHVPAAWLAFLSFGVAALVGLVLAAAAMLFFNNAGIGVGGNAEEATLEQWRHLMSINLDAVRSNGYSFQIEMTHRVVRHGGRVVA